MEERKELFSRKVFAGKRVYFLDIKETKTGVKYLTISENTGERNRLNGYVAGL